MNTNEHLSIRNFYIFGMVMQDAKLCREVLETLLETPVGELSTLESEKDVKVTSDGKSIRLDIYAKEADTGKVYDAEMQNLNNHSLDSLCLPKRSRYYQSLVDIKQLRDKAISDYRALSDTEIVFICTFDPFGQGLYKYEFEEISTVDHELRLGSGTRKSFFNTTSMVVDIPEPIRNLFEYINSGTVSDRLTQRIDDAVMIAGRNSDEMEESMRFEMLLADAEISGYDRGITDGRTEGIKEGIKEGMLTGRTKECFEIATRLIDSGMKPDKIAKICGISIETVKKLRDGNADPDSFSLNIS